MSWGGGQFKKINIFAILLVAIGLLSITTLTSYALFTSEDVGTNSINLTISTAGTIKVRIYKEEIKTDVSTLEEHLNVLKFNVKIGYVMDTFSCTTGEATYDKKTNILTIKNATDNGSCTINYKKADLVTQLLGENNSNVVTSGNGLYMTTETNSGKPSYYYRGNVENNYIKLDEDKDGVADTLYRIIRINEDGSIRIIRQDGIDNNTGYVFNPTDTGYKYMYYSESNVEGGIMKRLEDWYSNTFGGTELDTKNKIVESEFCEQAKITWYDNSGLTLTAGSQTMTPATNSYKPTYKCVADANGKGILNKKVGLINIDEVVFAGYPFYVGESQTNNTNTYLQIEQYFWTISPIGFYSSRYACAWYVNDSGYVYRYGVNAGNAARPVINLSNDIVVKGSGTSTDPFEIVG